MTSKEAYNYLLGLLESGGDMRWPLVKESMDKIKELIDQQSNPTLFECIKEWEERGYRISEDLFIDKCGMINNGKNYIYITLKEGQIKCGVDGWVSLEELNLLYKTLKALEVENENCRKN